MTVAVGSGVALGWTVLVGAGVGVELGVNDAVTLGVGVMVIRAGGLQADKKSRRLHTIVSDKAL